MKKLLFLVRETNFTHYDTDMKGMVLAGGTGSRLWPITQGLSKQLLPIYDKPMVFYPISTLMLAGIRDILVITTPDDRSQFENLLGNGSKYGINLSFETQPQPNGIAEAFLIGENFIERDSVALILGDNIFHGVGLGRQLKNVEEGKGANIFVSKVADPERYGVIELNFNGIPTSIVEKPHNPKSNLAVTGLYFYDNEVIEIAKSLKPSDRGELEITDVNREYLSREILKVNIMERGTVWLDTGTVDSLHAASTYVKVIEDRQGVKIACLEEIAWRNGWISDSELAGFGSKYGNSPYGNYLKSLLN
jgi:glucose-1-phosphate thymidylyltransferase